MKQNRSVYGKTIPSNSKAKRYPDQEDETAESLRKAQKAEEIHKRRHSYTALSDEIAQNLYYVRNWKWPKSDEVFPHHPDLRTVDKYYPYAKGGALLVDEPRDKHSIEWAYKKQKFLKSLGFRHIVIEENATLFEILEQLGEI